MSMGDNKMPDETPAATRVPKHGGGLLRTGNPGNKGGRGVPSIIRQVLRERLEQRIHILEQIADGAKIVEVPVPVETKRGTRVKVVKVAPSPKERMQAIDILAKYGLGTKTEISGEDGEPVNVQSVLRFSDGQEIVF